MYQNIVLSPLFFDGLRDLSDLEFSNLLGSLLTERVLSDKEKNILKEYDKKLNDLDTTGKITPLKKAIIPTLTLNGIIKLQENVITKERNEKDFDKYESEKVLASSDNWKIILTSKTTDELKRKLRLESDIEIANINEYSSPSDCSHIRALETIEKEPGQFFNFRRWITKYVKDAKRLIIKDPYICIGRALSDIQFLISQINKEIQIEIFTLSDLERNRPRKPEDPKYDGIKVTELLEKLKLDYSLSNMKYYIIENKKELMERTLITDKWRMNVGHAFGSVDGELVIRNFVIEVKKISDRNKTISLN